LELVIVSGKGGTGKTTIATAISELAKDVIRVDCDVDAPNLYLFYKGNDIQKSKFIGGKKASIDEKLCIKCGKCESVCKFKAIDNFTVNPFSCEGCGACTLVCPQNAIELKDEKTADTFVTKTDKGIISRAEMDIGGDGSGKLINSLRENGKKFNKDNKLTIIDGSPGIGCPVMSSITGTDVALVVTEPTESGFQDLIRIIDLCNHFEILTMVCINKYDVNYDITNKIEKFIESRNLILAGKIPYDDLVMKSINEIKPIICYENSKAKDAICDMWDNIKKFLN
jgi:MinD superfamily P-loop ATPase